MKILFFQWHAFMQKGIENAFKQMKIEYDTVYYTLKDWDNDDLCKSMLKRKIVNSGNYDIVFSVNFAPVISDVCQEMGMKYISWVYDSPIHIRRVETMKNSCNTIYFFDRGQMEMYQNMGIVAAKYMPLAVDTEIYDAITVSESEESNMACDISLVGQLYKSDYEYLMGPLSEYNRGYIEGVVKSQLNIYGGYFLDSLISDDFMESLNEEYEKASKGKFSVLKKELEYACACEITSRERYTALALLSARHNVNLYSGDKDKRLSNVNFKEYVDYYSMMPKVFKTSKINLNISLKTIRTGIPLRVLDVLGCGGFLLTNYQQEILEYFEPSVELVVYESMEDMVAKADYYLKHPEEREMIARNGYQKVKELFRFEDRLKEMFDVLF